MSLTRAELCSASGLDEAEIEDLESYGLLEGRSVGADVYYDGDALVVAQKAAGFIARGIEPRHLRMFKVAAEREAGFLEQVVMPMLKQRNPDARQEALEILGRAVRARAEPAGRAAAPLAARPPRLAGGAGRLTRLATAEELDGIVAPAGRARSRPTTPRSITPTGVLMVGVLKGSVCFLADLVRRMTVPVSVDFLAVTPYAPGTGRVRLVKDLDHDVAGRAVVVVEDIVDTGLTLGYLRGELERRRPGVAGGGDPGRPAGPAAAAGRGRLRGARGARRVRHRVRPRLRRAVPQPPRAVGRRRARPGRRARPARDGAVRARES